jgi:hypothetical protein
MKNIGKKDESKLLAVIGDISGSRRIIDRAQMQRKFESAIRRLNRECAVHLAATFVITLGDEFQGLLSTPGAAIGIIIALEDAFEDIEVRYSLGWGGLTTGMKSRALGMDGPCFHNARDALLRGKKEKRWVTVQGFGDGNDFIINSMFELMNAMRRRWTEKQKQTVSLMRKLTMQKEVAETLGVVPSVVSETLNAAHYRAIIDSEHAMELLLREFGTYTEESTSSNNNTKQNDRNRHENRL